jgi:phage-related protein
MPAEDVAFTFNPRPIVDGVKQIEGKMSQMVKGFANTTKKMTKSVSRGIVRAVRFIGTMFLAVKGVGKLIKEMPEIGQAFGIAKDIIFKNLLWPLRKEIMPLLQKMLDWVRDHRAMFVKWGQAIANIFRVVVLFVNRFIDTVKQMMNALGSIFKGIFGDQIRTVSDFINIMLFKIASMVEFIGLLIEPIFDFFKRFLSEVGPPLLDLARVLVEGLFSSALSLLEGIMTGLGDIEVPLGNIVRDITKFVDGLFKANEHGDSIQSVFRSIGELLGKAVDFIAEIVESFTASFLPAIQDIMTPIQRIVDAFDRIFTAIFGGSKQLKAWKDIFSFLGGVVGEGVMFIFEGIASALELAATSIEKIVEGIQWIIDHTNDVKNFFGKAVGDVKDFFGVSYGEKGGVQVGGNIGLPLMKPTTNNVNVGEINNNITVTEGNAYRAGEEFGRGLKDELQNEAVRQGR